MPNFELKAAIVRKFGSQADFAREIGVREERISRAIYGRCRLTQEEAEKMAKGLGINASEIFSDGTDTGAQLKQCLA